MAEIHAAVPRTCMKCGGEYTTERPEVLVGDEACGYWKPRLSAHRECINADPTPAAPDPQPRVCSNCGAVLGPKETGHFVPPSVGESGFYYCRGAAPDQAEGPDDNRGDDVPSVTSRAEESVMDKGVFRYDTDKTRLGAPLVPWDPSHREIL